MHFYLVETLRYYLIYVVIFIPFLIADAQVRAQKKSILPLFIGTLLLCIFAGIRDTSVGIDTQDTLEQFFYVANKYNSFSALLNATNKVRDPAYLYLSYFLQKITKSNWIFLFVMQLLTTGPIAILAYKNRNTTPVTLTMLVFVCLFYQESFNIARQCAAASFLLLAGYEFVYEKKKVKPILLSIIAFALHNTALIGIALYLIIYLYTAFNNKTFKYLLTVFVIIILVILLINWSRVTLWLVSEVSVLERYSNYANTFTTHAGGRWFTLRPRTVVDEVLRLVGVIVPVVYMDRHKKHNPYIDFISVGLLGSLLIFTFFVITLKSYMGVRISLYLDYLWILVFSEIYQRRIHQNYSAHKRLLTISFTKSEAYIITFCILYNLLIYMMAGYGETIYYKIGI